MYVKMKLMDVQTQILNRLLPIDKYRLTKYVVKNVAIQN